MARTYFVSQKQLDKWLDSGTAELGTDTMSFRLDRQYQVRMSPAMYFVRIVSSPNDTRKMTGKVLELDALKKMGAESLGGSIVLGDDAYDVEEGFLLREAAQASSKPPEPPAAKPPKHESARSPVVVNDPSDDVEMLAAFVLSNLRSGT